jgi:hypothetical protein
MGPATSLNGEMLFSLGVFDTRSFQTGCKLDILFSFLAIVSGRAFVRSVSGNAYWDRALWQKKNC